MTVRTRMAPSPTGEFHIGGMRTLLYNYAFAKKEGGKFILRIEDTDQNRLVPGALERLMQVIKDYGLGWDEGPEVLGPHAPYVQSERLEIYKDYADKLVGAEHAYYCFCTKERLVALREEQTKKGVFATKYDKHCLSLSAEEVKKSIEDGKPYVIRLNIIPGEVIEYEDLFLGKISVNSSELDDQVLLKSDGFPTYHLAVVVDDYLMKITHIMRGVEWLPSTPKHLLISKAFGWEFPKVGHLPNLKEVNSTKKLSKRDGSVNATEFLREGYLAEALLNFLMFLGWNPGTEKEIYSLEEFISDFSLERIHKTDLVAFDREKLLWYNGYYIRSLPIDVLHQRIISWAKKFNVKLPDGFIKDEGVNIVGLVQERLKKLSEVNELISYFYEEPNVNITKLLEYTESKERSYTILSKFKDLYLNLPNWDIEELDVKSHELIKVEGYKPKEAFMTLRIAVSGVTATPQIFDTLFHIGKDRVLERIDKALKLIDSN